MNFQNKKVQKFISSLIIISMLVPAIFLSFKPKQASAQFVVTDPIHTAVTVKIVAVEVLKQFLMAAVRKLLNQMTQNTINWINNGFHGNPLYLENPESFFKDIAKFEVRRLVDLFGYDSLRYPFGKDFSMNIINSYQNQLADNAQYSLSKVINDPILLDSYRNDFNVGGWNGFLVNTQYPQNNYLGFQMVATEELARRLQGTVQNNAQKVQTTLQQGMGFLSPQTCPSNPKYNNGKNEFNQPRFDPNVVKWDPPGLPKPMDIGIEITQEEYDRAVSEFNAYKDEYDSEIAIKKGDWAEKNTCPGGLVATTPGSVVGSQIGKALGSKMNQAELGAALGNSFSAIFDALLNKFIDKGLSALTNRNYQGEGGSGDGFITAYNSTEGREAADGFLGAINTVADIYGDNIASGSFGGGGQCDESGNQYAGALGDAESAVLANNPDVADLPNIESGGRQNARTFLKLVETELISKGFNATVDVKNGNGNPSTGDIIGIWKAGDEMMERYDAIIGAAKTIREAATTSFAGFIPLDCTASGGGRDCGCKTTVEPPTECVPPKVIENNICVDPTTTGADMAKIDSINPVLALAGSAITINGTNLTNQVSFYDGNGARNTVVGTVNSDKTQTIVIVPTSLPSGNATVKIYQGNQIWSNGMLIAVVNTVGGGISTINPTTSWDVTQTDQDGWYPQLSSDGRYVAYGNLRAYNTDLQTKVKRDLTPAGETRCWGGDWIKSDTVSFVCEIRGPNGEDLQGGAGSNRYEYKVGEWIARKTTDDTSLVAGNIVVAADGHWVSWIAGVGRLVLDNRIIATGVGGGVSTSKNLIIHACTNDNVAICVRKDGILFKTYTPKTPNFGSTITDGYITYGGNGPVRGITPSGNDVDLTVAPWKKEYSGKIILVNTTPWVITTSYPDGGVSNTGYLLLRPWGEKNIKNVKAFSTDGGFVSIAYSSGVFTIATNTTKGKLTVITTPGPTGTTP